MVHSSGCEWKWSLENTVFLSFYSYYPKFRTEAADDLVTEVFKYLSVSVSAHACILHNLDSVDFY